MQKARIVSAKFGSQTSGVSLPMHLSLSLLKLVHYLLLSQLTLQYARCAATNPFATPRYNIQALHLILRSLPGIRPSSACAFNDT